MIDCGNVNNEFGDGTPCFRMAFSADLTGTSDGDFINQCKVSRDAFAGGDVNIAGTLLIALRLQTDFVKCVHTFKVTAKL